MGKNWMVDCQGPPGHCLDSTAALKYLARYVAGVAFHDKRILSADEQGCVLHVKDYRHDTVGTMRLLPTSDAAARELHGLRDGLKASWALSSRRIKSATTRLVVMAVTLVITACDTLWLAAEPAPGPSRLTNHHAAADVQRGADGERRRTPASGELHPARSQAFLASACSVATTLDIEQLFLSPIPDT